MTHVDPGARGEQEKPTPEVRIVSIPVTGHRTVGEILRDPPKFPSLSGESIEPKAVDALVAVAKLAAEPIWHRGHRGRVHQAAVAALKLAGR